MPIVSLDGQPVGDGSPGPVTRRLRDLYWQAHRDPRYITPVDYSS
jgi:branched-chain amino acid aminotransferase